jgi:Family of unknown function (DUF6152)
VKFKLSSLIVDLGLLVAIVAIPASAHHSVQAEFDFAKPIVITGKVAKMEWVNPHAYLFLDVADQDGKVKRWALEMAGPQALRKAGLGREERGGIKEGETVTIDGFPAKDGSSLGFIKILTLPNGRKFTIWYQDRD